MEKLAELADQIISGIIFLICMVMQALLLTLFELGKLLSIFEKVEL